MAWDGYGKKTKLPSKVYSRFALFLTEVQLPLWVIAYLLIFFVWPYFGGGAEISLLAMDDSFNFSK